MDILWKDQPARIREMGTGAPVVLVHGYPLDGAMWSGVARALMPRFRVLKPDLPGRGDTPAPAGGTMEEYADFIEAILQGLGTPAGVAGFSMGGYAALALARRHPASLGALALVDTRAQPDDDAGRAKRDEAIATARSAGLAPIADAMVPKLLSPASAGNRDLVERVRRIILRQKPETAAADLAAMRDRSDSRPDLASLSVPTLVVVGAEDALTPPADSEAMASSIRGSRLTTIPGAGHLAPMERPGAVAAALSEFFGGTLRPPDALPA